MDTYKKKLLKERLALLQGINEATDKPLFVLSFVWLAIIAFELTVGVSRQLEYVSFVIWIIFIADFLLEMTIAPSTKKYLRQNWLSALSLILPAFRIFRIFQSVKLLKASRSLRSLNLLKIVSSLNRGVANLRKIARNYGVNYIIPLTAIIFLAGAAGIWFFENTTALQQSGQAASGIDNYGDALW